MKMHGTLPTFFLAAFIFSGVAQASLFGNNSVDDLFTVKSIGDGQIVLEGDPKTLKEGDKLYYAHPPYQFTITSVKGKIVTVAAPDTSDLAVGKTMMRKANDQVNKGIADEKKMKDAE